MKNLVLALCIGKQALTLHKKRIRLLKKTRKLKQQFHKQ